MIRFYGVRDGRLQGYDLADCGPTAGLVWIDLLNPTSEEERAVEAILDLQVPTRQEMAEIEESARLYRDGEALVMTAVLIEGVAEGRPSRAQTTFVITANHLVTVRYSDPMPFRTFQARADKQPELHGTPAQILVSLLQSITERIADVLEAVAADLYAVSTAIFFEQADPSRTAAGRNRDLQSLLLRLGRKHTTLAVVRESLMTLSRLLPFARQAGAWKDDGSATRLKALDRDVRSLSDYESQISAEIGFLQESTLGLINIEQNAIIKVFSIAAVLFLPPTLVGTVYGMNFEAMPELGWRLGYPLALLLMALSAVVPSWWFKRRGWL
jgi:magnesium transporter